MGTVTSPLVPGVELDRACIVNSDAGLEKTCKALMLQGQYRFTDWLSAGASYTLSRAYGDVSQESIGAGPILETTVQVPEYVQPFLEPRVNPSRRSEALEGTQTTHPPLDQREEAPIHWPQESHRGQPGSSGVAAGCRIGAWGW